MDAKALIELLRELLNWMTEEKARRDAAGNLTLDDRKELLLKLARKYADRTQSTSTELEVTIPLDDADDVETALALEAEGKARLDGTDVTISVNRLPSSLR